MFQASPRDTYVRVLIVRYTGCTDAGCGSGIVRRVGVGVESHSNSVALGKKEEGKGKRMEKEERENKNRTSID